MEELKAQGGIWYRWVHQGTTAAMSAGERRATIVSNETAALVTAISLAQLSRPDLHGALAVSLALGQAATYASVPLIAGRGWPRFARRMFGVAAVFWLSAMTLAVGTESATHLFLVAVAVGVWHIHGESDTQFAALITLAAVTALVLFAIYGAPPRTGATAAELSFSRNLNYGMTVLILCAFSIYGFRRTNEAERALEAAHARSESLVLNMLPPTIAERLKDRRVSIADRFDEATILFADIVNFTVLSERVAPVALVQMLDEVFSRFDALCDHHGLEKIKTIGDAYMVAAGIPEPRQDHVEAVADMALDMVRVLSELRGKEFANLDIRIGIHTGPVVAGVIGQRKFVYDLWGDAVNTASRMESHGLAGRIQVSREVYERLEGRFTFESRGRISVKGKGDLDTWFLVGRV